MLRLPSTETRLASSESGPSQPQSPNSLLPSRAQSWATAGGGAINPLVKRAAALWGGGKKQRQTMADVVRIASFQPLY